MPLQKQVFQFPFAGGLDDKTRAEVLEPGKWLTLSNCMQQKRGSWQKRYGTSVLGVSVSDGTTVTSTSRAFAFRNELVQVDGNTLYSRNASGLLASTDYIPQAIVRRTPVTQPNATGEICDYDVAYSTNGYRCVAWSANGDYGGSAAYTAYAAVYDDTSGALLVPTLLTLSAQTSIKVVAIGTIFIAVIQSGANIKAYTFDASSSSPTWSGASTLFSNADIARPTYDIHALSDRIVVAYVNNGGTAAHVTVGTFTSALAAIAGTILSSSGGAVVPTAIGVSGTTGDRVWVAWNDNGSVQIKLASLDPTSLAASATQAQVMVVSNPPLSIGVGVVTTNLCLVATGNDSSRRINYRKATTSAGSVASSGSQVIWYRLRLESRPFSPDASRVYMWVRYWDNGGIDQGVNVLVDCTPQGAAGVTFARPVATHALRLSWSGVANPFPANPQHVAVRTAGSKYLTASPVKTNAAGGYGLDLITTDFDSSNRWEPGALGDAMAMSGGVPQQYDGRRATEIAFSIVPDTPVCSAGAAGSLTGTYSYVCVYEWYDAKGRRYQSAPSQAGSVALVAQKGSIVVRTLVLTNKMSATDTSAGVRIVLYRNSVAAPTIYNRVIGTDIQQVGGVDTYTIVDSNTDTGLASSELLYSPPGTPGAALAHQMPPCLSCLCVHKDRLWGAADDQRTLFYSGVATYGEGYWFNDAFQINVSAGGPITALASMDGRLIIFKRNKIFWLSGEGPPDNGVGGDYAPPEEIPTDVGCVEPRSVVVIPEGVIFQSDVGIFILTRGLEVQYFGSEVEATIAANPVITSARLWPAQDLVLFSASATESGSSTLICYDVSNQVWSTWTPLTAAGSGYNVKSLVLSGGYNLGSTPTMNLMASDGNCYPISTSSYLDGAATEIPMTIETPWIKLGGLQGYQRTRKVVVLSEHVSSAKYTVSVGYDYQDYTETFGPYTSAYVGVQQVSATLAQQKCEAVRVKITTSTPDTGQGIKFVGLAFEIGVKPSTMRLGASQKA